jgi:hypothetical protein
MYLGWGEAENAQRLFMWKSFNIPWKLTWRWEDNSKVEYWGIGFEDTIWIELAHGHVHRIACVLSVFNIQVSLPGS